jgi:hypothetical protein
MNSITNNNQSILRQIGLKISAPDTQNNRQVSIIYRSKDTNLVDKRNSYTQSKYFLEPYWESAPISQVINRGIRLNRDLSEPIS